MKTVSLDLGTCTGFAIHDSNGVTSGTLNFKKGTKFHDSGFKALFDWLKTFLEGPHEHPDLEFVYETPHGGYYNSMRILFGLMGILHLFCDLFKIKLTTYSPAQIKKFWTGGGRADKDDMLLETQKKFPFVKSYDQSDAIAMLYLHLERSK